MNVDAKSVVGRIYQLLAHPTQQEINFDRLMRFSVRNGPITAWDVRGRGTTLKHGDQNSLGALQAAARFSFKGRSYTKSELVQMVETS